MKKIKTKRPWLVRGLLGFIAGIIHILSLPPVRNFIWKKVVKKGESKIVDAQARVVQKKKGFFR